MDLATVALMLLAGLLHATWHSLVKAGGNRITILAGMGLVAGVVAAIALPFVPAPAAVVWPVLILSVAVHVGYKFFLARAYDLGDLGRVFPLARGTVPLVAALLALITLGQSPGLQQWFGIALVSIGIIALALDRFGNDHPDWRLLAAVAGAGFTVACYSVLDAYGTRLMGDWLGFTAWLVLLDSVVFLLLVAGLRGAALQTDLSAHKVPILISGALGLGSFTVFLWALSRNPVGAVSALRETSVLFAGIIGVLGHGEALSVRRAVGAILIVCGIVIIAL